MSIDDLISKWESKARYHRSCYIETTNHDNEIAQKAKQELAEEFVYDLRKVKRGE